MAIEIMKQAAMTYQGSASPAAKQTNTKEAVKSRQTASEADTVRMADHDIEKLMKPVAGDQGERGSGSGGGSGQQTSRQLRQAVEKLRKNMMTHTEAVFGFHEGTNRVMIKIVDKDTKDIIKEYPPEETLDMIQKVWEMAGILVDEKG